MNYTRGQIENTNPKRCWVDDRKNVDKHHIVPVEYNGPQDGLTVPLCKNCHTAIHREAAQQYKTGKIGNYVNLEEYDDDEEAVNRALFLAGYVVKSRQLHESNGGGKAENARNMIQISCTKDELLLAHDLKKMLGFRSLDRVIKYVITEKWKELKKKGK